MNKTLKSISLISLSIFSLISTQGCIRKPTTPQIIKDVEVKTPIVHVVKYDETLEEISLWYTGKESNKKRIAQYNNKNFPVKLKKGDKIIIPSELVIKKEKFKKKPAANSKKATTNKKDKKQTLEKVDPNNILTPPPLDEPVVNETEIKKPELAEPELIGPELIEPDIVEPEIQAPQNEPKIPDNSVKTEPQNPKDARRIELLKELLEK